MSALRVILTIVLVVLLIVMLIIVAAWIGGIEIELRSDAVLSVIETMLKIIAIVMITVAIIEGIIDMYMEW